MELPEIGTQCAVGSCNRLDFLPFECDSCHKIFCKDHRTYDQHGCGESYTKDVKVPVCPLCSQPVPVAKGEDPNARVDDHIQRDCKSDKAKKLYTNRCSQPGCKKKELVPVSCGSCRENFCLKHRLETSHDCQGPPNKLGRKAGTPRSKPSSSSSSPSSRSKPQSSTLSHIGANLNRDRLQRQQQQQQQRVAQPPRVQASVQPRQMSEDEALAHAIAASMTREQPAATSKPTASTAPQNPPSESQPNLDEDEALAKAIAASLNDQPRQQSAARGQSSNTCTLS